MGDDDDIAYIVIRYYNVVFLPNNLYIITNYIVSHATNNTRKQSSNKTMININNREEIRDGELLKLGRRSFKKLLACE